MRRAVCRNIDKMHVDDIIAKQIEIIVDGIPCHRHSAQIQTRLKCRINTTASIMRFVSAAEFAVDRLNRLQGLEH